MSAERDTADAFAVWLSLDLKFMTTFKKNIEPVFWVCRKSNPGSSLSESSRHGVDAFLA